MVTFWLICCSSHLNCLKGPTITREVNLTCDAWQAGNADGYFAVTGHWIEEASPLHWELKSSLLGFTQISNAHNGQRLGQALFKIAKRVGIEHKVSCQSPLPHACLCLPCRLAMSLVTMCQIIQQCLRRWLYG